MKHKTVNMNIKVILVIAVIKSLSSHRTLPSPPKIVYGGFVPMMIDNQFSENINIEHKLRLDRTSKSLSPYQERLSKTKDKSMYKE